MLTLVVSDRFLELSDEEVLPEYGSASSSEYSDDNNEVGQVVEKDILGPSVKGLPSNLGFDDDGSELEEDEDGAGWGTSRRDYYNADNIETEADALEEEEEAIRLQKKQLESMTEADFGFDEAGWQGPEGDDKQNYGNENDGPILEILPQLEVTDAMGPEDRMRMLAVNHPEFELLAKEYLGLQAIFKDSIFGVTTTKEHQETKRLDTSENVLGNVMPVFSLEQNALAVYLAALSMYFALLSHRPLEKNGNYAKHPPTILREHPVIETLIKCRLLWEKVRGLQLPSAERSALDRKSQIEKSDSAEGDLTKGLLGDHQRVKDKRKKRKKSKIQRDAEAALIEADAKRAERLKETEVDLARLSASIKITQPPSKAEIGIPNSNLIADGNDSELDDDDALAVPEVSEKARRKKSLKFYTSQIAQKSNKRGTAGREAGGDADLPYRERLKDKQERLNVEAIARGNKVKDNPKDRLGEESDENDHRAALKIRDDGDYYDLVTARSQRKKASKAALAEARVQAAKDGKVVEVAEEIGADGKRAITYAIEKNKGLAPKRNKDVRNPRVKKRKKYEDKKKKLGSIRPIYKGGEGKGGYGGELTGIKDNLVKSIKL